MKKIKPPKSYLYGKNSVLERLRTDPGSILKVFLQHSFAAPEIVNALNAVPLHVEKVTEDQLTRIKRADRLQGIVAEVRPFKYTPLEDLLTRKNEPPVTFIFLDNINDPHNLGSIMRLTACFGNFAIIIPHHNACAVNDTVMHVASGGENYVPVVMARSVQTTLRQLKDAGYWLIGATVNDGADIHTASMPFPLCLVLGSEGKGIRPGVEKLLDSSLTLPMGGAHLSLNVAMATAVFCYEIVRQLR